MLVKPIHIGGRNLDSRAQVRLPSVKEGLQMGEDSIKKGKKPDDRKAGS